MELTIEQKKMIAEVEYIKKLQSLEEKTINVHGKNIYLSLISQIIRLSFSTLKITMCSEYSNGIMKE